MTTKREGTGVDLRRITEYGELLRVLEPRVVVGQEQADLYLDAIDTLTDLHGMSAGQLDAVRLLARLVGEWEAEREGFLSWEKRRFITQAACDVLRPFP